MARFADESRVKSRLQRETYRRGTGKDGLREKVSKGVRDRSRVGDFRKRGNSLEGFHGGTRPRATAQSIELSISRLVGSSDKVTHPPVPHLPLLHPPPIPRPPFVLLLAAEIGRAHV